MKINLKELIEKRWNSKWSFDKGTNSIMDEMVDAAVLSGKPEFAVILDRGLLKLVESECKFPKLKEFFVTGIFDLWDININIFNLKCKPVNDSYGRYSLITFSKVKPAKIRICAAPEDLTNDKVEWIKQAETFIEYYKELEIYINTFQIPDSLKSLVRKIKYADYRNEVFDVRYYSERFLSISYTISRQMKKEEFIPLKDLVETSGTGYLKMDDILISEEGKAYLITEDFKIPDDSETVPATVNRVLRLKSTMVTPEYLFLYLNSGIYDDINYLLKVELGLGGECDWETDWNDLSEIKVFIPASNIPMALDPDLSQKYRDMFNQKYRRNLVTEKDDNDDNAQNETIIQEDLEDLEGVNLVSDPDANDLILDLMRDVNKMVSNEIYIGAGILIGSILEAFLTGWLRDIENKDYFRDPVSYEYRHGKERPVHLQFKDAIEKIIPLLKISKIHKDVIRKKMEAIRSMRDIVHVRVHLKNPIEMTKSVCETALKDLEDIIKLRYRNFQLDSFMKKIAME